MSELPTFGNCRALERFFQGPVSNLFRAIQSPLGREVWIRALRPDVPWSSSLADSLRREAQHLGAVEHPVVHSLLDFVDESPNLWLVLQAVDGHTVQQILAGQATTAPQQRPTDAGLGQDACLSAQGAIALAVQLADGLAQIHEQGLVHATIDPQQLLISRSGQVIVSGLSQAQTIEPSSGNEPEEPATSFELPAIMSPEQLQGYTLDARSDVFSLGALLCQLLCPSTGFSSSANDRSGHWEALADVRPRIPAQLTRLVRRCLQEDPARRFSSMHTVAEELSLLLAPADRRQPQRVVVKALQEMGMAMSNASPARQPLEAQDLQQRRAKGGLLRSVLGLVVTSLALLIGSLTLLELFEHRLLARSEIAPGSHSPEQHSGPSGSLLVVAQPWAQIFVDGQLRATTPFAQAILLSPGTHYVRLEHPDITPVRREIEVDENEEILLSVVLPVHLDLPDAGPGPPRRSKPDAAYSP